jgi:hypothetical protein
MKLILQYLATDGFFLFEECGCRIVHSSYHPAWGGIGDVILESGPMRVRIELERQNMIVCFQPLTASIDNESDWSSFDLFRQMLTGEVDRGFQPVVISPDWKSAHTESYHDGSAFLHKHFTAIRSLFEPSAWAETHKTLEWLKEERVKRRFS